MLFITKIIIIMAFLMGVIAVLKDNE